jgi:uncharacterized protein DUF4384
MFNQLQVALLVCSIIPFVSRSSLSEDNLRARDLFLSAIEKAGNPLPPAPSGAEPNRSAIPLGLRYGILKRMKNGVGVEVDPDSVFHSGDRIRLSVEANDKSYLYMILRGSSGNWSLLFPSSRILGGRHEVDRGARHEVPLASSDWFVFDEQSGVEKLFVVLSRTPEPALENFVQAVQSSQAASLSDATVSKIRGSVKTGKLAMEKVTDNQLEKAVYVVDSTGAVAARVVVDINLRHD